MAGGKQMAYDERHVEHVHEHSGTSSGVIAALIILAAAVIGLGIVLFINRSNNGNVGTQQPAAVPQTTTNQQPATQPPVVVQERGAAPAPARTTVVHTWPERIPGQGPTVAQGPNRSETVVGEVAYTHHHVATRKSGLSLRAPPVHPAAYSRSQARGCRPARADR